ncbi:MAG: ABC transporter ATP-binding protein [Bacteroidetes bacterium]|nr:ABC transporter ATP-binding protein [Bacteroidota bacterium]
MSESVIKVENLSKRFIISHEIREPYRSLRDSLTRSAKKLLTRKNQVQQTEEEFWALKDLTFEVKQGDRVGIIGRNGAGKSTLLKILSRITEPTHGRITIDGRVASLLEVGTGFHPELTGRENVFLNGAILGMSRAEIRSKFDEIVAFAEVEKFLDTPVKRYSSGMYVRLAFAVAAHLEPEILIVDEVLAVGDAQFQKKCLGKMEDVSKNEGRTVLFVSHNMAAISTLCNKGFFLQNGKIVHENTVDKIIDFYFEKGLKKNSERIWANERPGDSVVKINAIRVRDINGIIKDSYKINENIRIDMEYEVLEDGHILWMGHSIYNAEGINVFDTHSVKSELYHKPHEKGLHQATTIIPANLLADGTYVVNSAIFNHNKHVVHLYVRETVIIDVFEVHQGMTARGDSIGKFPGIVRPLLNWEVQKINK